ncbi:uncharacterized protein BX663DRAFT_507866 [Cokeromyces recurvatus]|uniref:uncharacterized protein n=1 Tax=Cokeromyces recurvatus TaxID=90255 RepID=UPI00222110EC|nr:uncharacterized protein BX663DRAFT_507866 [Cokeromyces recurvatus]KAI7903214.1 hypothetical protein BX663DRAFT_507866 [Cokeromyces recurvatus]
MTHDHHDHSNCTHDHGSHGDPNALKAVDEINSRQQAADRLAKFLIELQELAKEYKKSTQVKTIPAVAKTDVEFLMNQFLIPKMQAESVLRDNNNDILASMNFLVSN